MVVENWSWILPVAKEAYENREEVANTWDKLRKVFDGKETTIAVTGLLGSGKSLLCDYLTGKAYQRDYQKPGKSEKLEKGKVSTKNLNIRLATVPGQDSPSKLQALDELFDQDAPIDGVIHVVANGFTNVRSAFGQELLTRKNALTIYRKSQFEQEVEDLSHICELIRKSIRRSGKPKWLLVAVTKIDLYYDDIETARDRYYHGESDFIERIQKLSNQGGNMTSNLDETQNLSKSFVPGGTGLSNDSALVDIDDLDIANLLNLAEEIQKSRDNYSERLDQIYLFRDILGVILLLLFALWLSPLLINREINLTFSEIFSKMIPRITIGLMYFFLLCILWGVSFNGHIRKVRRKLRSEQYTLEETVNLLREIQPILLYRQSQSKAKEIEFKLRLSRFNIDQQYEEPTSILYEILNFKKT